MPEPTQNLLVVILEWVVHPSCVLKHNKNSIVASILPYVRDIGILDVFRTDSFYWLKSNVRIQKYDPISIVFETDI